MTIRKILSTVFAFIGLTAGAHAAVGTGIGGQFIQVKTTLQSGATFYVSSGTVTNLNTNLIKFSDGSTQTSASAGGGGSASTMQTKVNGVQISSPTKSLAFDSNFTGLESPTGTANISLNPGTTLYIQNTNSLQSGATIYVSSESVNGPLSVFRSNFQALLLPSTTIPFELVNTTSHQLYMIFKTSGTEWWRLGSDVTGLGTPEYDVYNVTTGIKDIAISTNDVMNINATASFPSLTASRPMKLNASKQVTSGLIDVTTDLTGTVPDGNLPSNLVHTNVAETISSSKTISGQLSVTSVKFPDGTIQVSSAPGTTGSFINNQSTLQSGATFYVSSGSIAHQLTIYDDDSVIPFYINRTGKEFAYLDVGNDPGCPGFLTCSQAVLFSHLRTGTGTPELEIVASTQTSLVSSDLTGNASIQLIARNSSSSPAYVLISAFKFPTDSTSLGFPNSNGTFFTYLKSSGTISADKTFVLPPADSNGCWESDGNGNISVGPCNVGNDIVANGIVGSALGQYNFLGTTVTFAAPPVDTSDRVPILNNGAVTWPLAVTDGARLGSTETFTAFQTFTSSQGANVTYGITGGSLTLTGLPGAGTLFADASGHISTTTASGGGSASTLAVGTGTVSNFTNNVTSPTAAVSFLGTQFNSSASGTTNFISLANVATAGTYGSTTIIPTITINAQGQVIALSSNTAAAGGAQDFDLKDSTGSMNRSLQMSTNSVVNVSSVGFSGTYDSSNNPWSLGRSTYSMVNSGAAGQTFTGASSVTVNGLQFWAPANSTMTGTLDLYMNSSSSNSGGWKFSMVGPASPVYFEMTGGGSGASSTTANLSQQASALNTNTQSFIGTYTSGAQWFHFGFQLITGATAGYVNVKIMGATGAGNNFINSESALWATLK